MLGSELLDALFGGALIGLAASILLLFNGKIAGVSGITGSILKSLQFSENNWRILFILGLVLGGFFIEFFLPGAISKTKTPFWLLALSGFLVGFGSSLGNGCTSGHGVCGISRFSVRSIIATCTFMALGMLAVFIVRVFLGAMA